MAVAFPSAFGAGSASRALGRIGARPSRDQARPVPVGSGFGSREGSVFAPDRAIVNIPAIPPTAADPMVPRIDSPVESWGVPTSVTCGTLGPEPRACAGAGLVTLVVVLSVAGPDASRRTPTTHMTATTPSTSTPASEAGVLTGQARRFLD